MSNATHSALGRFPLGQIVATPGALEVLQACGQTGAFILSRHARGDWGDLCDEDKALNDEALVDGGRLLSAYKVAGAKLWIITEAEGDDGQRAATTILLPEEY